MVKKKTKFFKKSINWWFLSAVILLVLPLLLEIYLINNKNINFNNALAGFTTITRIVASFFVFMGFVIVYKSWYTKQIILNQKNKENLKSLSWFELELLTTAIFKNQEFKIKLKIFESNHKLFFTAKKNNDNFFIDVSNWNSDITKETIERTEKLFNVKNFKYCYLLTTGKITQESYLLAEKSSIKIFNSEEIISMIKNTK